ncbi:MAG TPA: glycosyltransferase [Nevskiales bacterium]|nr:glycosyltransferase [Nevskiales bacterium]
MILHTVATIDVEASGPVYSVRRLCEELLAAGTPTKLAVLDWMPGSPSPAYVQRFPVDFGPRRLGRSPAMAKWMLEQVRSGRAQIIHSHGLWMMNNVYPGRARRAGNTRLVISPRGTVSEWAWNHHRGRKWVMWHLLGQKQTMQAADAFHATSEEELLDLRHLGFRQPVCVQPNGIDVPPLAAKPQGPTKTLLYLGRIHKIKGIDLLLRAWAAVERKFPDWRLVVAGPDDGGYLAQYRALAAEFGLARVTFPGPVYGKDKLELYRSAYLFVLPTHSENFGMTVVEALAAGTPAIVTKGAPWARLVEQAAGWWIDIGVDPLVAALEEALALPDERLVEMGRNGRAWMICEFSWSSIAQKMAAFYDWLQGGADPPHYVRVD